MRIRQFLIERWIENKFADGWNGLDLASSTGPAWSIQSLGLDGSDRDAIMNAPVAYRSAHGGEELRHALADAFGANPRQLQVTTGASEALLALFFTVAAPGTNVIVPEPGYSPFTALPESFGVEVRPYRLRRENNWRIDVDEIKRLVDGGTTLVLINSPHNPTGGIATDDDLDRLDDFMFVRGIVFVVDEVYSPIYHDAPTRSAVRLPHATVVGDLSKALCLPGLRVGWIVEPDDRRRERLFDARAHFTVCNSSVCEDVAIAALKHRDRILNTARARVSENLPLLDRFFAAHDDLFGWIRPRGGLTAFPWLRNGQDGRALCTLLLKHGLLLLPGDCFGMPEHFRIGFGSPDAAELRDGLERFEGVLGAVACT